MRHIHQTSGAVAATLIAASAAFALSGNNGYTPTRLFGPADIKASTTYPAGFPGVEWSEFSTVELWAPTGNGQRDGIAADASGNLYVLVRGRGISTGGSSEYTGLVRYDGTNFEQLTQDRLSDTWGADGTGAQLQTVIVSPSSVGLLTAGHPVLLRHVAEDVAGSLSYSVDIVSVDPASGAETPIWSFDLASGVDGGSRVAIDGSGGGTDGVVFVGPLSDGRIAALTWNGSSYDDSHVPGSFRCDVGLIADGDGYLYTFEEGETWSGATKSVKDIYRVDPTTGAASVHASVAGSTFPFDWEIDAGGSFWMGLRRSGRKTLRYVTEVFAGATTSTGDRISESDADPASITTGPVGEVYVLENPFDSANGEVWKLEPGSGDGGSGGGGGGKGGGKGKNK